jgi:prepilin-type N-terminal cleavage/methylation domain-containing protein
MEVDFGLDDSEQTMRVLSKDQRGFSLMELLAYLAMLGMLLSVIYSIFYQFSRTLSAADRTMLKERSGFSAVHMLQDDIRRSSKILDEFGSFRAAEGALILLARNKENSGNDVVIYRFFESESTLTRHEVDAENPSGGVASQRIGFDIKAFEFSTGKGNAKLIKVSLLVKEGPLGVLRNKPLVIHALMRNG